MKKRVCYTWNEVGSLEICEQKGNSFTLRFKPSKIAMSEMFAQLSKTTANQSQELLRQNNTTKTPDAQKRKYCVSQAPCTSSRAKFKYNNRTIPIEEVNKLRTFRQVSECVKENIKQGDLQSLVENYIELSCVLESENNYIDALKSIMIAFYISLNGSGISKNCFNDIIGKARYYNTTSKLTADEVMKLYFSCIREDMVPKSYVSSEKSFRAFQHLICNKGK